MNLPSAGRSRGSIYQLAILPIGCLALAFWPDEAQDVEQTAVTPAVRVPEEPRPAPVPEPQDKPAALPSVDSDLGYEFENWKDEFPYQLHKPPRRIGEWYDRNAQQALEKVVQNLSGLCTQNAWRMSKEFFDRHLDVSRELLVEKLDETQRNRSLFDHAENILNAMGRQESGGFSKAIARALSHDHVGIRAAASRAMVKAGDEKLVLDAFKRYRRMSRIERLDWLKAAANHLSDERLFEILRMMLTKQDYADMQAFVFEQALKLPPKRAAKLFEPLWLEMPDDLKLHVAGVMHAAGVAHGTELLKRALRPPVKIPKRKIVAIQGATKGDPTPMLDELLALTLVDNPELNVLVLNAIRKVKGSRVNDTLVTMTDVTRQHRVRQYALLALRERGQTSELDTLVETVAKEPEGTKYRSAIADLVGARYGKVVPVLLDRMKNASSKAEIYYIRMMARINQKQSFPALVQVFMRPEYTLKWRERHSNVTIMGVQFSNVSVAKGDMIKLLDTLPRADYRRRAALIHALANLAGAMLEDREVVQPIYDALRRRVFDADELPQIRILALDYMRKDLRLQDAMDLRARLRKEKKAMRQYLSDYLFEFF